jgi:hypothetical protein
MAGTLTARKKGTIRKILRGVYDYPIENVYLEGYASPDLDKVAQTIARSNGWKIVPDGLTALTILRLSTQIPAAWNYFTDGPSREYSIDNIRLSFKKRAIKETSGLSWHAAVLVQGIKEMGQENLGESELRKIGAFLSSAQWKKTIKECRYVTAWVLEIMKKPRHTASRSVRNERSRARTGRPQAGTFSRNRPKDGDPRCHRGKRFLVMRDPRGSIFIAGVEEQVRI